MPSTDDVEVTGYVDLTPSWVQILPTWLMMYEHAAKGDCTDPDLIKANTKAELTRMAKAADSWNQHCKLTEAELINDLRERGWALAAYSPDEVGDADREELESIMHERGRSFIEQASDNV